MQKSFVGFAFAFVAVTLGVACEVDVNSGPPRSPQPSPQPGTPASPAGAPVTPAPAPTPAPTPPKNPFAARANIHRGGVAGVGFTGLPNQPAQPGQPAQPPGQPPIMTGTNIFGNGNADTAQTGFTGTLYWIPTGTASMPAFQGMQAAGFLFSPTLAVTPKPMTGGFPGIDPNRNEWFGIEWEAPLVVDTESDYTFRVSSDDGAIVKIDGTKIVDDDGAHGLKDASGPVHLVKGTHDLTIDYFQATQNVALQLFCTKAGGSEQICPAHLP